MLNKICSGAEAMKLVKSGDFLAMSGNMNSAMPEELMVELKRDYTIALVTHNMQQAIRVADTTAFFSVDISRGTRTGYLVEMGPTDQIFNSPREKLTADYISGQFS